MFFKLRHGVVGGFLTKMIEGKPKSPKNDIFWKKHFLATIIGWLVGGCGARAVSRKTHIYFIKLFQSEDMAAAMEVRLGDLSCREAG